MAKVPLHANVDDDHEGFVVRFSCADEMPVDRKSLCAFPTFVRVKQTRSWQTASGWRYDVSRVWSGASVTEGGWF